MKRNFLQQFFIALKRSVKITAFFDKVFVFFDKLPYLSRYSILFDLKITQPVTSLSIAQSFFKINLISIRKAFDIHFVTNESDNKLILFERRFDVIFTSFSSSFKVRYD